MPLLQVRDMPEDLYDKLTRVARAENRSIAQETIALLRGALNQKEERIARRSKTLSLISELNISKTGSFPDPAHILREDRDR